MKRRRVVDEHAAVVAKDEGLDGCADELGEEEGGQVGCEGEEREEGKKGRKGRLTVAGKVVSAARAV